MNEFHHPEAQKDFVIKRRKMFFNEIIEKLSIPPGGIDDVMNQDQLYIKPSVVINDSEMGNLLIDVEFADMKMLYSIYQIGRSLRVGVLISDEVFQINLKYSFDSIWREGFAILTRGSNTLMEWTFSEPDLLSSWITQEEYVLGIRHMHFRILTSLKESGII